MQGIACRDGIFYGVSGTGRTRRCMDAVVNTTENTFPGLHNYHPHEERLHALTHFLGLLLVVGAVPVLLTMAALYGNALEVVTFSIYSATLITTYLTSTLYHGLPASRLKVALRRADHMCIYLLIAGTYTPFLLVALGGPWGWSLFGVLWGLAAFGIGTKFLLGHRFDLLSTLAYVAMGWIGLVAFVPLMRSLPTVSVVLVITGGVSYTVGALFYMLQRMPYHHVIWHLFCLSGSILQFIAVFFLLAR